MSQYGTVNYFVETLVARNVDKISFICRDKKVTYYIIFYVVIDSDKN